MPMHRPAALAATVLLVACGGDGGPPETGSAPDTAAPQQAVMAGEAAPPDTTAAALWAHLEAADPRANWQLWPGTGRLHQGSDPHGALLTTYVNALAYDALTTGAPEIPAGAIVVKENFAADSTLAATTVMLKAPGYDPGNGDWFWLKRLPDGTDEVAGRAEGCIACHAGAPGNDMLHTSLPGQGG